jgi:Tol biopolymer transport system component
MSAAEDGLWAIPLRADQEAIPLIRGVWVEDGAFSPDGEWIAFSADNADRQEIHVQSFPEPHTRLQVSVTGGYMPRWSDDGRELFFMAFDGTVMVSEVTMGDRIAFSAPVELFRIPNGIRSFDVSADGQRFLVVANLEDPNTSPLTVILNWKQLLENNE